MKQVIDGYEITTARTEAAEQTKRGIESFIEWRMDPFDWLDRALETDSDCVFASLVKGLLLVTARSKKDVAREWSQIIQTFVKRTWMVLNRKPARQSTCLFYT